MSIRTFASSIEEVRYFQRRGGPTIDGSTPISEIPNVEIEYDMYTIQLKSGKLLAENEVDEVDVEHAHDARWFPYYLQATEYASKKNGTAIGSKQVMKIMSDHITKLENKLMEGRINEDGPREYTGEQGDAAIAYD